MTVDLRVQRLKREIAASERLLRELQRRKDREPAVRDRYYRLKAELARRKAQLAAILPRVQAPTAPAPPQDTQSTTAAPAGDSGA